MSSQDASDYLAAAEELRASGEHERVLAILDRGIRFCGPVVPLLRARGAMLSAARRLPEALEALEWALANDSDDLDAMLELADVLGQLNLLDECLDQVDRILDAHPDNERALYQRAEALRVVGRFDEALEISERLLRIDVDDVSIHRQRALILSGAGRPDDVLAAADGWLAVDESSVDARLMRAWTLADRGEYEAALDELRRAHELEPENVDVLRGLAQLVASGTDVSEEQLSTRLDLVEAALRADGSDAWSLRERPFLLSALDRPDEAGEAVQTALRNTEPDGWLYRLAGRIMESNGDHADAVAMFRSSEDLEPGELDSYSHGRFVVALRMVGELEEAAGAADVLLEREPDHIVGRCERAELCRLAGDFEQALEHLDRVLAQDPENAFALGTRGQVLLAMARPVEAADALQQAAEADSDSAWIQSSLGEAKLQVGDYDDALDAYERALETGSGDLASRSGHAEALRMAGRFEQAVAATDALLAKYPDDAFVGGTRAAALGQLLRYEQAIAQIEPVLEADPDYQFGWSIYCQFLARVDRHTDAHVAADRALALDPDDAVVAALKGMLFLEQAEYQKAIDLLDDWMSGRPANSDVWQIHGEALARAGRLDDAERSIRAALELEPAIGSTAELADLRMLAGDDDGAARLRSEGLDLLPTDRPPTSFELAVAAWCSLGLADTESTVRHYLQATTEDPYVIEWQFALALSQLAAGQRSIAFEQLASWQQSVRDTADATRRAGILAEVGVIFDRARRMDLVAGLSDDVIAQVQRHVADVSESS